MCAEKYELSFKEQREVDTCAVFLQRSRCVCVCCFWKGQVLARLAVMINLQYHFFHLAFLSLFTYQIQVFVYVWCVHSCMYTHTHAHVCVYVWSLIHTFTFACVCVVNIIVHIFTFRETGGLSVGLCERVLLRVRFHWTDCFLNNKLTCWLYVVGDVASLEE